MSMKYISQLVAASALAAATTLASAVVNPQQGTWTTTLQGRDLNGDMIADAFYDTVLNVTWLADANWAGTTGYADQFEHEFYPDGTSGRMALSESKTWAAELNMYGVTGWRLHKRLGYSCVDHTCYPTSSEISHLYFETLGNRNGGLINTGPFTNAFLGPYWSVSTFNNYVDGMAFVYTDGGRVGLTDEPLVPAYAWAVHNGDVGVIPEPGTYALFIAGIAALGLHRKYGRNRAEPAQTST